MGVGTVISGPVQWHLGGESASPCSPRPPPALGQHSSGTSGSLAGSPVGIGRHNNGRLLGQPLAAKLPQHPCPVKGQPWASKGMTGQGQVVRLGGVANLPPLLAARPP